MNATTEITINEIESALSEMGDDPEAAGVDAAAVRQQLPQTLSELADARQYRDDLAGEGRDHAVRDLVRFAAHDLHRGTP